MKKTEKYPTYTNSDGTRISFLNWRMRLVRLTSDCAYVELCGMYNGKKNYYIHAHKDSKTGIYFLNPRNVKIPQYAIDAAVQLLENS